MYGMYGTPIACALDALMHVHTLVNVCAKKGACLPVRAHVQVVSLERMQRAWPEGGHAEMQPQAVGETQAMLKSCSA